MDRVIFHGKQSGALGVTYSMTDKVESGLSLDDVRLALYNGKTESGKAYDSIGQHIDIERDSDD